MTMCRFDMAKVLRQQALNSKIAGKQTKVNNFVSAYTNKTVDTFLKETKEIVHYPLMKKVLNEKIFKIK